MALGVVAIAIGVGGTVGLPPAPAPRPASADETTTTTDGSSTSSTTSTTVPGSSTSTTGPTRSTVPGSSSTTSTTVKPGPSGTLPAGDGNETDVGSAFGPQAPFDPASKLVLPDAVARAEHDKRSADLAVLASQDAFDQAQRAMAAYQRHAGQVTAKERRELAQAEAAQKLLVERAVSTYMEGGAGASVDLLGSAQPSDIEMGLAMLDSVFDSLAALAHRFTDSRDELSTALRVRLSQEGRLDQQLETAATDRDDAVLVDQAAGWQVEAFQDGSHVWIPGFVFPVEGPTRFVDSFGDARLSGTNEQHWHEGCDVMSVAGTPLVAVDDGVLTDYGGGDPLGGKSLRLTGAGGYWYYYAHLSAFVPTLHQGDTVTAGEVIGYVGSTGDAAAPHLHFEIHAPDGQVLDSYGMLAAAWKARQQALHLTGTDPGNPPDPTVEIDPGTVGGFPRYPDGTPVTVESTAEPPPSD